ncbi:NUDIX domain-containing protein [Hufsiella ginkgonis]|uniref:NUDIX domain-containing protein n=1 Tax=Hufsiella ginkgonis TaxID=2695274 RepID=A0A7K1XV92_9SPHI|nr:NUDIX domain-containing protein [Hufsiella ginkgonis]MXV14923.1 NUDIX domain-containing protein [Hufsiella ginkgonis]
MQKKSAGIVLYRFFSGIPEFLLVHPGGPFFAKKDAGVWSVPKGEFTDEEDPLTAAIREFEEELGLPLTREGDFLELEPVTIKSGKRIFAWATRGDLDPAKVKSNTFPMEWPPKSGKIRQIEEVDKAAWCSLEEARIRLNPAQVPLIEELYALLSKR